VSLNDKRLSVFFEVLPYHTVRIFLLSPAPTHYRHVQQINIIISGFRLFTLFQSFNLFNSIR
jgi:hypothetical protein